MKLLCVMLMLAVTGSAQVELRRVFVKDHEELTTPIPTPGRAGIPATMTLGGTPHISTRVMGYLTADCHTIEVTQFQSKADLILETQAGRSILNTADGKLVYISTAKSVQGIAKDVCYYLNLHPSN